jgi:hypothetical protein
VTPVIVPPPVSPVGVQPVEALQMSACPAVGAVALTALPWSRVTVVGTDDVPEPVTSPDNVTVLMYAAGFDAA